MSTTEIKIRKRSEKINSEQKKIILQLIASTPQIISHSVTADFSHYDHQIFWLNTSNILNLFGPPRRTPSQWKKVWKDYKIRFRKAEVDLIDVLNYVKKENPIDSRSLLQEADRLKTNSDRLALRKVIWDVIIDRLPEIIISNFRNLNNAVSAIDDDLNIECESISSQDLKNENSEDGFENQVFELEEQIIPDDAEIGRNNSSIDDIKIAPELPNKRNSDSNYDPQLTGDESKEHSLAKRSKLSDPLGTTLAEKISAQPHFTNEKNEESSKNDMKMNVFEELVLELRKFNQIQAKKLALRKNYIEFKKSMLKNSSDTQKEIAKSQELLATSVKTFVDNISFNL